MKIALIVALCILFAACGKKGAEADKTSEAVKRTAISVLDGKPVAWEDYELFRTIACADANLSLFVQETATKKGVPADKVAEVCSVKNAQVIVRLPQ